MPNFDISKAELGYFSTIIFQKIKTFKDSGNDKFRSGNLEDAEKYYKEGLAQFDEEESKLDLSTIKEEKLRQFFVKDCWGPIETLSRDLRKNLSIINFKRKDFNKCIDIDSKVFKFVSIFKKKISFIYLKTKTWIKLYQD